MSLPLEKIKTRAKDTPHTHTHAEEFKAPERIRFGGWIQFVLII